MPIPHMCTVQQAAKELKASGCTVIGETALRRWIKEGKIPHVASGKRKLINMDKLQDYLNGGDTVEQPELSSGIRAVPDRLTK